MEIVAVDIGGTHARFAIAEVSGGRVQSLGEPVTLKTAEHGSLRLAWEAAGEEMRRPIPRAAGIAVATPIGGEVLKLTNNPWVIRPALIKSRLGVDDYVLVNDFEAVAHAVAQVGEDDLRHLCGPDVGLPETGMITIVGPGTGLGVAHLLRTADGYHVLPCEGGHVDFAPLDALEDRMLAALRKQYRRVSIERIVSGPGLVNIYEALPDPHGTAKHYRDDKMLWAAALDGSDSRAAAALDRFCLSLGAVSGDLALAHGAHAVVIAGGLGLRIADHLPTSGFAERFVAKGRFERIMSAMPVKFITHPQPGLFGAAAAFAGAYPA
ncbi:glucokinase [Sphingomonas prati]|uniref:Glucokinase n=1 Tax=Sphingomonas prati TaxID=1843237 RepID=A0A7W9BTD8_9SPHN|nr:glucokinase [Sphingomonas prati]MBB5729594.1 glucokinase [Sphingomonas prati]GGE76261.1 glucokinase [Sphingomonas prati]